MELEAVADENNEDGQQRDQADHAEFFGQHSENKVGVTFGQEVQVRLGAAHIPFAEQPA